MRALLKTAEATRAPLLNIIIIIKRTARSGNERTDH